MKVLHMVAAFGALALASGHQTARGRGGRGRGPRAALKAEIEALKAVNKEKQAEIEELMALNEELMILLNDNDGTCLSVEEAEQMTVDALVANHARQDWVRATLPVDRTLDKLDNGGRAQTYDVAGFPIYDKYSPEAGFFLANAGDDSLLRDMQGAVFQFPNSSDTNTAQQVSFKLPDPPEYNEPKDLIFMPILQIAALLRAGTVSCPAIVDTFIARLEEFDPYLAIVASTLYDQARETALLHQEMLDNGVDVGPLMCIPFGVKDHHQIGDDDVTTYGNILYKYNQQTTKSTVMAKLMQAGAIPIAKTHLGTYAWGATHGWGQCMSPYLNGDGGGSSCGSGSGAALGALPFAISEETSGSIASPAFNNLISGHIGSYGTISRTGAGLLCGETDHFGFHSRYLTDYGVIFNYLRTGADPMDGDSLDIAYKNPQEVDLSSMRVMIIDGIGEWVYDATQEQWNWEGDIPQNFGKSGWHWKERADNIKAKLEEAGVAYDTYTYDKAGDLWSFDESTPFFECAAPDIDVMMAGGPWAKGQDFEYGFINSKWWAFGVPGNIPKKDYRYMQYCMVQIGKLFLNDEVWDTYDVIIDTHAFAGGGYPRPGWDFEQWVRTAKTFVVDYMETLPCLHSSGAATEGALTMLTAKPFEDYKNFAIGALIQDPASLILPNDEAIKATFEHRTRCALEFFEGFNDITESCPALNSDGGPPQPYGYYPDGGCEPNSDFNHMNEEWSEEPYVAPYNMEDPVPDRALFRWDEYGQVPCTAICPFVPSFCEYKGIICDAETIEQEVAYSKTLEGRRRLSTEKPSPEKRSLRLEMERVFARR